MSIRRGSASTDDLLPALWAPAKRLEAGGQLRGVHGPGQAFVRPVPKGLYPGLLSLRAGTYRIIYKVDEDAVWIYVAGLRKERDRDDVHERAWRWFAGWPKTSPWRVR